MTLDVHVISMTDAAPMYLRGMKEGWDGNLEKLAQLLKRTVSDGGANDGEKERSMKMNVHLIFRETAQQHLSSTKRYSAQQTPSA